MNLFLCCNSYDVRGVCGRYIWCDVWCALQQLCEVCLCIGMLLRDVRPEVAYRFGTRDFIVKRFTAFPAWNRADATGREYDEDGDRQIRTTDRVCIAAPSEGCPACHESCAARSRTSDSNPWAY